MRTVPIDIDAILLASKTADVRLTFRRRKLVFTSQVVTDSQGLTDPSDLDVSGYNGGALRVANINGSLYTQLIVDLSTPSGYASWVDQSIDLAPGSRPGVEDERIWYQKSNGDICYRDYTSISTENFVSSDFSGFLVSLAPMGDYAYIYGLPCPETLAFATEERATFGSLWIVDTSGEWLPWNGHIYGDITTPQYLDAVSLNGIDYVYVMDRAAGRVMEITRQGDAWSYGNYIVPIDAIDNITGVTLRYATVIKNQVFVFCRVVNSSDNDVPVSMDAIIFGPAVYDAGILDSRDQQNYSFSRWSYLTTDNVGGKLIVPGDGYAYYLGANELLTSVATILVGEDPASLKFTTSDLFSLSMAEQENQGAQLSLQMAHDFDTTEVLDDLVFEFGYNTDSGEFTQMGVFTILNTEEAGGFGLLQYNLLGYTSSFLEMLLFTPHQSYSLASQDKITSNPSTMTDVVVSRGIFGTVLT